MLCFIDLTTQIHIGLESPVASSFIIKFSCLIKSNNSKVTLLEVNIVKKESLLNRILASLMHFFSLFLTFILPILVYLGVKGGNKYFVEHAKEGMNLHFTFFPIFLILNLASQKWSMLSAFSYGLITLEAILILIAVVYTLKGKKFSYPVIRYFKV